MRRRHRPCSRSPATTTGDAQSSSRYRRGAISGTSCSRSSTVHATQWLFAWPATRTASNPSRCSTRAAFLVPSGSPAAPRSDLRPEHRVVLGQRVLALDLEARLRAARDRMEEERLLDGAHERVADPAEQRVERPDRELVLPPLRERLHVRPQVLIRLREPERLGSSRVDPASGPSRRGRAVTRVKGRGADRPRRRGTGRGRSGTPGACRA